MNFEQDLRQIIDLQTRRPFFWDTVYKLNKLKSLKVAQVKDEMDDDEDDGCEGVFDV